MESIAWLGPLRLLKTYSRPLRLFLLTLALLICGNLFVRSALPAPGTTELAAILQALASPTGLIGMLALALALVAWARLLWHHQLSFFYPLWGLTTTLVLAAHIGLFATSFSWLALLGAALVLAGAALLMRGGHL